MMVSNADHTRPILWITRPMSEAKLPDDIKSEAQKNASVEDPDPEREAYIQMIMRDKSVSREVATDEVDFFL